MENFRVAAVLVATKSIGVVLSKPDEGLLTLPSISMGGRPKHVENVFQPLHVLAEQAGFTINRQTTGLLFEFKEGELITLVYQVWGAHLGPVPGRMLVNCLQPHQVLSRVSTHTAQALRLTFARSAAWKNVPQVRPTERLFA